MSRIQVLRAQCTVNEMLATIQGFESVPQKGLWLTWEGVISCPHRSKLAEVKVLSPSSPYLYSVTGADLWAPQGALTPAREGSSALDKAKSHWAGHIICL